MIRQLLWMFAGCLVVVATPAIGQDKAKTKVTFQDQAQAVFRSRCNSCHNADKQKGGLNLESYATAIAGGSSGKVIEPGDAEGSSLLGLIMQTDEPKMPPNSPKIPDAEIEIIRQWIAGGALDSAGSTMAVKAKPKFEFKLDPNSLGKPSGEPAMPVLGLSTEPVVVSSKATAITALATSPWAPILAVGSHKQVLIYHAEEGRLMAVLPFPEGFVYSLKFSRNGDLLLAGGGRGGQSGLAVAWNVKTGKRVFEVGKEYDAVLAADISPDHGMVAIGGPSKMVKVFNTADGQLLFEMKKHTEWVTSIEFSPDGVLLATGDRNGGLIVWEGQTGREFYDLRGHSAMVTDVAWRLDSNVLGSTSEDGSIRLWEMENGTQIKTWGAHGGGVASVAFAKDGRIISTGRDRVTRLWDANGGKQRDFEAFTDLALDARATFDGTKVIGADYNGELREWSMVDGARIMTLASNPLPVVQRIVGVKAQLVQVNSQVDQVTKEITAIEMPAMAQVAALQSVQAKMAPLQTTLAQTTATMKTAETALVAATAAEVKAQADLSAVASQVTTAQAAKKAAEEALAKALATSTASVQAVEASRAAITATALEKTKIDQALAEVTAALAKAPNRSEVDKLTAKLNDLVIQSVSKTTALAAVAITQAQKLSESEAAVVALAAAQKAATESPVKIMTAQSAMPPAQSNVQKATAVKVEAAKVLEASKVALAAATNAVNGVKPELDKAIAAKTAADVAIAAKKADLAKVAGRKKALEFEAKALEDELKAKPVAKTNVATTAAK